MSGTEIVNTLAILLIVTSLLVVEAKTPHNSAHFYSIQSFVLVVIFLALAVYTKTTPLYIWSLTALVTKVILVPYIIHRALRHAGDIGDPETTLSLALSLLIAAAFVGIAMFIVAPIRLPVIINVKPALAISIAHFLLGLLCILTQRSAMKQILGYCLMENGAHLALALMAFKAPQTVIVGIVTDAIFAVVVMSLIADLFRVIGTLDTDKLNSLKG